MTTMMRNSSLMRRFSRCEISDTVRPASASASNSMMSMPFSRAGAEYPRVVRIWLNGVWGAAFAGVQARAARIDIRRPSRLLMS